MFYEERIVNGILCKRHSPKAEWTPLSKAELSLLVVKLRKAVLFLKISNDLVDS